MNAQLARMWIRPATLALIATVLATLLGCAPGIPDVRGLDLDDARTTLSEAGFELGNVVYDPCSADPNGTVLDQDPLPGSSGAVVDVLVAGEEPSTVPDLVGLARDEAIGACAEARLSQPSVTETHSADVAVDVVVAQGAEPGSVVPAGTVIDIIVSLGPEPPPSSELEMVRTHVFSGAYSPKSVVATDRGTVFAQNMMYRHTISVFDEVTYEEVATIDDSVRLADYGYDEYSGTVKGAPVEAAVAADGESIYVSNYSMYGPGFSRPGDDVGGPSSGMDDSFVYRIGLDSLEIDQVIKVGSVPKFMAVTPDGRYLLVSNWISYTVSVVDVARGEELQQIQVGRYPRGIAVDAGSRFAYVAVMGSRDIAILDLESFELDWIRGVGQSPRHLNISPEGDYLYATLNGDGTVVKIDLAQRSVVARVATGSQPRSMAIAPDGLSLYVVNYESNSVSKVRTSDMAELQELPVGVHPIGVTYCEPTGEIWVACYRGSFYVFGEQ